MTVTLFSLWEAQCFLFPFPLPRSILENSQGCQCLHIRPSNLCSFCVFMVWFPFNHLGKLIRSPPGRSLKLCVSRGTESTLTIIYSRTSPSQNWLFWTPHYLKLKSFSLRYNFSVTYYQLSQTPNISNYFCFPWEFVIAGSTLVETGRIGIPGKLPEL